MLRRERNRRRSKLSRQIRCPAEDCGLLLESVSQKHHLYAQTVSDLEEIGYSRRKALVLLSQSGSVTVPTQWLEAFWCNGCQSRNWYLVKKVEGTHQLRLPAASDWQRTLGTASLEGNVSVSEFSRRQARRLKSQ